MIEVKKTVVEKWSDPKWNGSCVSTRGQGKLRFYPGDAHIMPTEVVAACEPIWQANRPLEEDETRCRSSGRIRKMVGATVMHNMPAVEYDDHMAWDYVDDVPERQRFYDTHRPLADHECRENGKPRDMRPDEVRRPGSELPMKMRIENGSGCATPGNVWIEQRGCNPSETHWSVEMWTSATSTLDPAQRERIRAFVKSKQPVRIEHFC